VTASFTLPLYIDLSATFLYAMTGALLAIRRHYDWVGLFVLALVSGVGGGFRRGGGPDCHWLLFCFSDSGYRLQLEDSFAVTSSLHASVSGEI